MAFPEDPQSRIIDGLRHELTQVGERFGDHLGYGQRHFPEVAEQIIAF